MQVTKCMFLIFLFLVTVFLIFTYNALIENVDNRLYLKNNTTIATRNGTLDYMSNMINQLKGNFIGTINNFRASLTINTNNIFIIKNKPHKHYSQILDNVKPRVLLAIGILSKLSAVARRNAIRQTWFQVCRTHGNTVACRFFTDQIQEDTKDKAALINERNLNDTLYMPLLGGFNFSLRLLWMLKWFTKNYEFDYYLRIDDDYFLCLDRLLKELPSRPKTGLYWGWLHCQPRIVRVDEGFMILSRDIISEVLGKFNTTLMCHKTGDQMVAVWILESKLNITYFADNARLAHEVTSYRGSTYLIPTLCNNFLGLHGTYPNYMHKYWNIYTDPKNAKLYTGSYIIPGIKPIDVACPISRAFDFNAFGAPWHAIPRPCKDNPRFDQSNTHFPGREIV